MDIYNEIKENKIVPVIKIDDEGRAQGLAEALLGGGLPVAEITFRTAAAEGAIRNICKNYPEMLVGAGTVTSVEQAKRAVDAGAKFLVSAGFSRKVVEYAVDHGISIFPGVCTPTEIMLLLEYHLNVAKFFPAESFGGLQTIKALAAPFPDLMFMPTGGINASNINTYLSFEKILACGGSWMVKEPLIREGNFSEIRKLTQEAVNLVKNRG